MTGRYIWVALMHPISFIARLREKNLHCTMDTKSGSTGNKSLLTLASLNVPDLQKRTSTFATRSLARYLQSKLRLERIDRIAI